MLLSASFFVLALLCLVSGAPVKRAEKIDITVFQVAHVLESLEAKFYADALKKFQPSDISNAGFSSNDIFTEQITQISVDEATHQTVIAEAIKSFGAEPLKCNFDFSKVLTDINTMIPTARVFEQLGVGAYMGAIGLLTDAALRERAMSIMTTESRHDTILNVLGGAQAIAGAFDLSFAAAESVTIAAPFISGCDLGIKPNPSLTATNTGPIKPGTSVTFKADSIKDTSKLFCQMLMGGAAAATVMPLDNCVVPEEANGPVAVWVTKDNNALNAIAIQRDANTTVAGPTMFIIDAKSEALGAMVRNTGSDSSSPSTTTKTISPASASGIVASATGSAKTLSKLSSGPNTYTGPSPDGNTVVKGWSE
jgi:hypothetical protein